MVHVITAYAAGVDGLEARLVPIEARIDEGPPSLVVRGLSESRARELRVRVLCSIESAVGLRLDRRLELTVVNACPPVHTVLDLAATMAALAALGRVDEARLRSTVFLAELSLGGALRTVRGALPCIEHAHGCGMTIYVARGTREAALAPAGVALVFSHLSHVLRDDAAALATTPGPLQHDAAVPLPDFAELPGMHTAASAIEEAIRSSEPILLVGPPGARKLLLARAAGGVLPPLTTAERLEVARVYSVAGLHVAPELPFRAPHYTAGNVGLFGGGPSATPGELSLAHRGILFLDDAAEFSGSTLAGLRAALEAGEVCVRATGRLVRYPARPRLVIGTAWPCPCGRLGWRGCSCSPDRILSYERRWLAPLRSLFPRRVAVIPPPLGAPPGEPSAMLRARLARRVG